MSKLDDFKLTEGERDRAWLDKRERSRSGYPILRTDQEPVYEAIADAATAKALQTMATYLQELAAEPEEGQDAIAAYRSLADELEAALAEEQPRG